MNTAPTYEKRSHSVAFGKVKGENRGKKSLIMNPPKYIEDDYFWLRNDKRDNEEIISLLKEENKYFEQNVDNTLAKKLEEDIISRMEKNYDTIPLQDHSIKSENKYFARYVDGENYYQYYVLNNEKESLILDINELAKDKDQCDVSEVVTNYNETILSYGVDYNGSEFYEIVLMDLASGTKIESKMETVMECDYLWINNRIIAYLRVDKNQRPFELVFYDIYEKTNKTIYRELDDGLNLSCDMNSDNNCLFITSSDYDQTKIQYIMFNETEYFNDDIALSELNNILVPICDIQDKVLINADYHDGMFYFLTNSNGSVNYKITCEPLSKFDGTIQDQSTFTDFIPYNKSVTVTSVFFNTQGIFFDTSVHGNDYLNFIRNGHVFTFNLFNDIIVTKLEDWSTKIWENNVSKVYNFSVRSNIYDDDKLLVSVESMTEPVKLMYLSINEDNTICLTDAWKKVIPNYDKDLYTCERVLAPAQDGVSMIPCSLMYRKDMKNKDKGMPLYMYGYGAYGMVMDTQFSFKNITLLDHGYCFVICHIRGGAFLGQEWYEDGRLHSKMNTFTDFYDCRNYLASLSYIDGTNITCEGRSAGGLLAGAMASMYPTSFKNIIMGVPFTDVMITMCDSSIPLTIDEWTQWGNPNIESDFNYMKTYCPYTNLKKASYPNIYITTGFHDPRVQYWEGVKFIAKLRDNNTNMSSKQIIEIQMGQGHFGNAGRYKSIGELSKKFAFVFDN
jgi:oligopeptidase B